MGLLINGGTASKVSEDFYVDSAGIGLVATGLAGAEEIQVQVWLGEEGGWVNIVTNGKLTVAAQS